MACRRRIRPQAGRPDIDPAKRSNFVFAHFDGGSCRLHLLEMLKKVQTLAGIKGRLRIHDLRHALAFRLRRSGVHLETTWAQKRDPM